MRIANDKDDAIQIIKQIKSEMRTAQNSLARLEFLLYELDDRAEIKFFERGEHDKKRSEERVKTD
jgi:hypothetical protein